MSSMVYINELKKLTTKEFFDLEQSLWREVRNCYSFYQDEYDDREVEPLELENIGVFYDEGNESIKIIKNGEEFFWSEIPTSEKESILIEYMYNN